MNIQEIWNFEKTVADRGFGTGKGMSMTREEKINAIICDEWQGWSESDLFEYFRKGSDYLLAIG